jgi:hypothetical protein
MELRDDPQRISSDTSFYIETLEELEIPSVQQKFLVRKCRTRIYDLGKYTILIDFSLISSTYFCLFSSLVYKILFHRYFFLDTLYMAVSDPILAVSPRCL